MWPPAKSDYGDYSNVAPGLPMMSTAPPMPGGSSSAGKKMGYLDQQPMTGLAGRGDPASVRRNMNQSWGKKWGEEWKKEKIRNKQQQNSKRKLKEEKKYSIVYLSQANHYRKWLMTFEEKNIFEDDDDVADDNLIKVIVILEWQLRQKQQFWIKQQHFWYPRKKSTIFDLK